MAVKSDAIQNSICRIWN